MIASSYTTYGIIHIVNTLNFKWNITHLFQCYQLTAFIPLLLQSVLNHFHGHSPSSTLLCFTFYFNSFLTLTLLFLC